MSELTVGNLVSSIAVTVQHPSADSPRAASGSYVAALSVVYAPAHSGNDKTVEAPSEAKILMTRGQVDALTFQLQRLMESVQ
jgi:hypothetical protein